MAKPSGIDWNTVKTEYVTTRSTYSQLSEKYHVSIGNISKVSRREGWREQRKKFEQKVFTKTANKAAAKEANHLARLMDATNKAIGVAMEAFEDDKQFNRYIVTDGLGGGATETNERIFSKVDTKALKDLTGVLKDLTALMREYYNLPTPAQAEAQRIAAERLELDKRKAEADNMTDTEITVKFASEDADEYSR